MTTRRAAIFFATSLGWCLSESNAPAFAQGYGSPLRMQGVNQFSIPSAASRATGGLTVGLLSDPSMMFVNPASLQGIAGVQLSLGGTNRKRTYEQNQQWIPMRSFPTFSLLMEGLLDQIEDPDLTEPPPEGFGPEDTIPRPFDTIKPNWNREDPTDFSVQAFAAVPVEVLGLKVVGGLGVVEYSNLNYYFQNNNVLTPSIGTQRPVGIPLPAIGELVNVEWTQYAQQREGSIFGYGGAVSVGITDELSLGVSGLWLDGRSDDYEMVRSRGLLQFGNNNGVYFHRLDSVHSIVTTTGTSEYYGAEYSISSVFNGGPISIGLMVKPPSKVSRRFEMVVQTDTTGSPTTATIDGRDKVLLPWRGALGISFAVREDLTLGLEYEVNPLASAEYISGDGESSYPWLSNSVFRAGAEFVPVSWMILRAGFREQAEIFEEEGNALPGEPVRYTVYALGLGLSLAGARLNFAYEFSTLKYQDMWQTNVNLNVQKNQALTADISYVIQ